MRVLNQFESTSLFNMEKYYIYYLRIAQKTRARFEDNSLTKGRNNKKRICSSVVDIVRLLV